MRDPRRRRGSPQRPRRWSLAPARSKYRPSRAPARTPPNREYRRQSTAGQNRVIRRSARRRPTAPTETARPKASFRFAGRGFDRQSGPDPYRQPDQVDEAQRVFLVVAGAHREARYIERVERMGRLAAKRLDRAFVQSKLHFARDRRARG